MPPRPAGPEWAAEITIDEPLVRQLIGQPFPGIERASVRLLAEGWDNAVWLANDMTMFRFPRRAIAVPGVEREIRVLPRLADCLPVPIPSPEHVGRPSAPYPWPFFGGPVIEGDEPARTEIPASRGALGAALGASLRVLHAPETLARAGAGLPYDPNGRGDLRHRIPFTRQRLASLPRRLWPQTAAVETIFQVAVRTRRPDRPVLAHGDLHGRHILLGQDASLAGIIDWGDVCVADPAVDLSLYWSLLDADGRSAFRDGYASVEIDELLPRARVLALFLNAALALYADDTGDANLRKESLSGLERTLVSD